MLHSDVTIPAGETWTLDPRLEGVVGDSLTPIRLDVVPQIFDLGLECAETSIQNPTSPRCPFQVHNPTSGPVALRGGMLLAKEAEYVEEDTVLVAAVLDEGQCPKDEAPPDLDNGGIEFLNSRGFSLDKAVDPEKRRPDGSYEPLSDAKKRVLYTIALRWYQVWAVDAKVPKISYLVVIDIPTGNATPVAQQPYPIATKLRAAAMAEINKLLKAGLIEPCISDWASPAMVTVKKDSTPDNIKLKWAIDYRRVNALTELDAGGLGTQSDILYGVGGKFKFLGLCDAAGGFYQYLLSPEARKRSAFILPASMGGTLFQWRVAPYGLTRNPAGYSRGMQWVLKGLHDLTDLGDGTGKAGATSWLDDICMRATTFDAFAEIFELVLSRLAMASMTLKGSKCELLHEAMDILGFVATPHGLMMQKPKLSSIMDKGIPTTPKQAMTFLGAVAFLRRMVPRISLLSAPMTNAIKNFNKRFQAGRTPKTKGGKDVHRGPSKPKDSAFNASEQEDVNQSWHAIVEHLDGDVILAAPDFEDPLAHFVICTDASDYAVGGVLMQWQHPLLRGPGPPDGVAARHSGTGPDGKAEDPLDSRWRRDAGWELKVISYYSKTLDDAQKHYPAFDKEAGAALLCCRAWADLITYHPTTLYTDSAVATSMLTKHMAPPRLQRWGAELGTFLPHLRISYRKGSDNGLADLLSRFPAFRQFTACRDEEVTLPDDYFDYVGEAPLYLRKSSSKDLGYLKNARYELYEPRSARALVDSFWVPSNAPEIPNRGRADRVPTHRDTSDELFELGVYTTQVVSESVSDKYLESLFSHLRAYVASITEVHDPLPSEHGGIRIFTNTYGSPPTFEVLGGSLEAVSELTTAVTAAGGSMAMPDETPDVVMVFPSETVPVDILSKSMVIQLVAPSSTPMPSVSIGGHTFTVDIPSYDSSPQHMPLVSVLDNSIASLMNQRHGMPVQQQSSAAYMMAAQWATAGYGGSPRRLDTVPAAQISGVFSMFGADAEAREDDDPQSGDNTPQPGTEQKTRHRARRYDWQEAIEEDEDEGTTPVLDPTVTITLEMQMQDPHLRLLIDALSGSRRVARAMRQRTADKYELLDEGLHRIVLRDGEPGLVLMVPRQARAAILARYHYSLADGGGHAGGQTMYDQIRLSYFWPDMERECHDFVQACEVCGGTRSQGTIGADQRASPTPDAPFQVIHVDHKGPLPLSGGYTHVLCVVCALTKFTLYIPVKDVKGDTTLRALRDHVFSIFGNPLVVISDNGSSFANKLMKASERLYGYRQVFSMPHTPQANGLAESAVKKLKLILDRHTLEYQGWHLMLGMVQSLVNQRVSSGSMECPFTALFGRQPITLAALENPSLLPTNAPEEKSVRELAFTMSRMHKRLQHEIDSIKDADVQNAASNQPRRTVEKGDKIWLTYSDSERARYLRKHGHGTPWRHPFEVADVKPHAVKLIVPKDGSVPDVLPWQSLRKCALAASRFHDDDLPIPETDSSGTPLVPNEEPAVSSNTRLDTQAPAAQPEWTTSDKFIVERIVRAERMPNGGWKVYVKWAGYGDDVITAEPLSRIKRDVSDPEILDQIERCKESYLAAHPAERRSDPVEPVLEAPTRVQPSRAREAPTRMVFHLPTEPDTAERNSALVCYGLSQLGKSAARRCNVLSKLGHDFGNYAICSFPLTSSHSFAAA